MVSARIFTAAWESFLLVLAVSLLHRGLAFQFLAGPAPMPALEAWQCLLVGGLSDVWVSYLTALLTFACGSVLALTGFPQLARLGQLLLLCAIIGGLFLHQGYVEFFHFQVIPYHLRYLFDATFLAANGVTAFSWQAVTLLVLFAALWLQLLRRDPFGGWSVKRHMTVLSLLTVASLWLHNRNIYLRVQWFIPENLQVHAAERLYIESIAARLPEQLSAAEFSGLAALANAPVSTPFKTPVDPQQLFPLLTRSTALGRAAPRIAADLHASFTAAVASGRKPVLMFLLLESLRPAETGYFAPSMATANPSLTPNLDQAAAHGIAFSHAYSTGSVTRGAQEAVFCGYLGSRDTSLMRGAAFASIACLPDLVGASQRGEVFWYHGGDARFDGQVSYWRLHGVREFLSLKDFPDAAPRTGWGIADRTYLKETAARLADFRDRSKQQYLLGMGLTVTNHIPWALPADAGPESTAARTGDHPSYSTTSYTDSALGDFIQALHSNHLWQDLMLVLVSDHGTNLPPLVDLYKDDPNHDYLLQSHINLVLTGGLVDHALAMQQQSRVQIDDVVSQADTAAFAAYIVDLPAAHFMGQNLFAGKERSLPVLSDLEQDLFDHGSGHVFSRTDVVNKNAETLPINARQALLYYRAFLQYIYSSARPR